MIHYDDLGLGEIKKKMHHIIWRQAGQKPGSTKGHMIASCQGNPRTKQLKANLEKYFIKTRKQCCRPNEETCSISI